MPLFRVGKPRVRVWLSANQTHNPTGAPFVWDAIVWSEGESMWPGTDNSKLVCPRTGLWLLNLQWRRAGPASTASTQINVGVNGASVVMARTATATGIQGGTITSVLELDAGDVIDAASSITVAQTFNGGGNNPTALSLTRIGPERWT